MPYHHFIIVLCLVFDVFQFNILAQPVIETEPTDCKVKYTYGYHYSQFFRFSDTSFKNGNLLMRFIVRTVSDAHILLVTSLDKVDESNPVYEIVLGAGQNRFSEIRRMRRASTRQSANTPNILSAIELRAFWIRLTNDGLLAVGKEGEKEPFLSWKDDFALQIRYFGFSTWTNVYGKWFYDCESQSYGKDKSMIVEKPLTMIERLRRGLLTNYDPLAIPKENISELLPIDISFRLQHVELDSKKSEMTIGGTFMLAWDDDKLKWEPSEFGEINNIQLVHGEIWRPELILYNSVGHGAGPLGETGVIVSSEGRVNWNPNSMMQAHCNLDLSDWPWDEHTCELQLGLWGSQNYLQLVWTDNAMEFIIQRITTSGWEIIDTKAEVSSIETPWNIDTGYNFEVPNNTDTALVLQFVLRRTSTIYNYVFIVPLIVIAVTCLTSFGLSPLGIEKIGILCLCLTLCSMFIFAIDNALPSASYHAPYIFVVYSRVLVLLTISTVSAVFTTSMSRKTHVHPPQRILITILQNPSVQLLLYLPRLNQGSKKYNQMNEDTESCNEDYSLQYWTLFVTAIDRITFFAVLTMLIVVIFFS